MAGFLRRLIPQSDKQAFWLSFFLCFFFCYVILVAAPLAGLSGKFGAGNDGYIQLARSLVRGDGYVFEKDGSPVFHRPPMYPLFLVPVAVFPQDLQRYIIIIPQSILVGFIGMLIFRIARQLYNQNVAAVALLLFLVNPWVYWNAKNPMTGILQTFLYLIFIYSVMAAIFEKGHFKFFRSGLIIGISGGCLALTHGAMLPVIFILIFVLFVKALFGNSRLLLTSLIAAIVAICFIVPWTYRNWVVFHKFIPVAGGGGLAYFNGNVHWSGIEAEPQKPGEGYINASLRVLGIEGNEATVTHWKGFKDIHLEELADGKMTEHIKNHPGLFVKKVILNAIEYYFPVFTKSFLAVRSVSMEQRGLSLFHLFLWIPAIAGIFYFRNKALLLLAGIAFYSVWYFPFATFIGHSLYTLGTIPFLSILAAAGIVCFFRLNLFVNRSS